MAKFMAVIETDIFRYEIDANIDDQGVNVLDVYFGGETLSHGQLIHFINAYGEADLDNEILNQYSEWVEEQRQDKIIEHWQIQRLERRSA